MGMLFCSVSAATCATITYVTPAGSTFNTGGVLLPEDFSVTITTAANSITVALTNNESNPTADTQAIAGLSFVLDAFDSNAPSLPSTPPQGTGNLITISSNTVAALPDNTDKINHWQVGGSASGSTTTISMDVFSGGKPNDLVIGSAPGNIYSNANPSVTGHNPFIQKTATFIISLSGVTGSTNVTSATFSVGTTSGQLLSTVVAAPEPGTWMLISLALPFGAYLKRRRK